MWESWRISGQVGTALETWEPACNLRNTEALAQWEARDPYDYEI